MLDLILSLYRVEYAAKGASVLSTEPHLALRRTESRTVLDSIRDWLRATSPRHPPKSPLRQAIACTC